MLSYHASLGNKSVLAEGDAATLSRTYLPNGSYSLQKGKSLTFDEVPESLVTLATLRTSKALDIFTQSAPLPIRGLLSPQL